MEVFEDYEEAEACARIAEILEVSSWEAGDALVISRRSCKPGDGLSYDMQTVTASEAGFVGGWDVWDGINGAGAEIAFYGFSVQAIISR